MTDRATIATGGGFVFAGLTLQNINAAIATVASLCGLVVVLPAAIRTLRETDWRHLFKKRPTK